MKNNNSIGVFGTRNTLNLKQFGDEVFNNLPIEMQKALKKSPRFYCKMVETEYNGLPVYCFTIERKKDLGMGLRIGSDSETRYRIENPQHIQNGLNLGKYRLLTTSMQEGSGVLIAEYGYDSMVYDTLANPNKVQGWRLTYECKLLKLYLHPFNLTKTNAQKLAKTIHVR